jgi:hypothetical protein
VAIPRGKKKNPLEILYGLFSGGKKKTCTSRHMLRKKKSHVLPYLKNEFLKVTKIRHESEKN